jgi:sulfatase maturation enzyme AslB (radical SAM superfamily)
MDPQLAGLLDVLEAREVETSAERIKFLTGDRRQELHPSFPLVVILETSSYCNLRCLACPQSDLTRPKGFMRPDLFSKVVTEVARHDVRTWLHFMGEPLINPAVFDLIEVASAAGLPYFGVSSNARLLTSERIERILDSRLTRFEISLDSIDPTRLQQLRRGARPEKTIAQARRYFERKYERGQRYPVTSVSIRELSDNRDEMRAFADYWRQHLQEPDFVLSISFDSWGGHESREHAAFELPASRSPCIKLWNTVIVLQDGRVVTCNACFDAQRVLGDANEQTIAEIWSSPAYRQLRDAHLQGRAGDLPVCGPCDDWYRELDPHQYRNWTAGEKPVSPKSSAGPQVALRDPRRERSSPQT